MDDVFLEKKMSDKKIQILRIRMNPERNIWDRQILEWLETLPLGYRTKSIKEALVGVINAKKSRDISTISGGQAYSEIDQQIDTLFDRS